MDTAPSTLDRLTVAPGVLGGERLRYFRRAADGPPWAEHLAHPTPMLPPLQLGEPTEVTVRTLAGDLSVGLLLAHRSDAPRLVVTHHGNNERAFDLGRRAKNSLNRALLQDPPDASIVLIRAAHHDGPLRDYLDAAGELSSWMAMLAGSVLTVEALVQQQGRDVGRATLVTGISLGGWVANLHRAFYGTADRYVPMLAGARLGRQMVDSSYRHMLSHRVRPDAEVIRERLDFDDVFGAVTTPNVAPLLARRDAYCRAEEQADVYSDEAVSWLDTGHIGASLAGAELRRHVATQLAGLET